MEEALAGEGITLARPAYNLDASGGNEDPEEDEDAEEDPTPKNAKKSETSDEDVEE